jgi:WD40 repeat protein
MRHPGCLSTTKRFALLGLFPVLFVVLPVPAGPSEPDAVAIARWIERLGSDRFVEREQASQALAKIGEPALEALRQAAKSGDLEVQRRAKKLIQRIEGRWLLRLFPAQRDALPRVALSPDGKRALSAGRSDPLVRLWDVKTGKELRQFRGHTSWVWTVAFSPDGKHILSGGADRTIRLWDAQTGKELRRFSGFSSQVVGVDFSPDGQHFLSVGEGDSLIRLWSVKGKQLRSLKNPTGPVWCAVFSPNGKHLVSGDGKGVARLWEIETGKVIRTFRGHTGALTCLSFSAKGRRLLSSSWDGTVRLWEVARGKALAVCKGHTDRTRFAEGTAPLPWPPRSGQLRVLSPRWQAGPFLWLRHHHAFMATPGVIAIPSG